jgi:hypothetical protein
MSKFEETLIFLDSTCKQHHIPYVVIGGFAVIAHGMQRLTQDIDVTIALDLESIPAVGEIFLRQCTPRKPHPIEFFKQYFVLPLIYPKTGIALDISAGIGGFDKKAVERAIPLEIQGRTYPICSFEDLIIYKLVSNRPQDHVDLEFLMSLKKELDTEYLLQTASCFIELERSDVLEKLNQLLKCV